MSRTKVITGLALIPLTALVLFVSINHVPPALTASAAETTPKACCPDAKHLLAGNLALTAVADEKAAAADPKKRNPAIGGPLEADPKATGIIKGLVFFKGAKPEMKPFKVNKDHKDIKVCKEEIPYERHIIGPKNELKNVVISLEKHTNLPRAKPREIDIDNVTCKFVPHVQATTARSKIVIKSQDEILHSALAVGAANFNVAIPNTKTQVTKRLSKEGWVIVQCATHSWMQAHIWVFRHDFFAVSDKDGKFSIKGIPPGEYKVKFWHEGLQAQTKTIKVEASKTAEVKVELEPYK